MKEEQISMAVMQAVGRYGLKKTTMADIADAAKVSRQTLYNAYPNKEAVLQTTVRFFILQDLKQVCTAWESTDSFEEKLDQYFEMGPVAWFDRIQAMPDAAEILEGVSETVEPALHEAHQAWIDALAEILSAHVQTEKAAALADFTFTSAKNAKFSASNRDQLMERLSLLKEMVITTYIRAE